MDTITTIYSGKPGVAEPLDIWTKCLVANVSHLSCLIQRRSLMHWAFSRSIRFLEEVKDFKLKHLGFTVYPMSKPNITECLWKKQMSIVCDVYLPHTPCLLKWLHIALVALVAQLASFLGYPKVVDQKIHRTKSCINTQPMRASEQQRHGATWCSTAFVCLILVVSKSRRTNIHALPVKGYRFSWCQS